MSKLSNMMCSLLCQSQIRYYTDSYFCSQGVNLINFLTSVPVSAVICAGSQFINIGTETARIAMDVVGCLITYDYSQAPLIDSPLAVPVIAS